MDSIDRLGQYSPLGQRQDEMTITKPSGRPKRHPRKHASPQRWGCFRICKTNWASWNSYSLIISILWGRPWNCDLWSSNTYGLFFFYAFGDKAHWVHQLTSGKGLHVVKALGQSRHKWQELRGDRFRAGYECSRLRSSFMLRWHTSSSCVYFIFPPRGLTNFIIYLRWSCWIYASLLLLSLRELHSLFCSLYQSFWALIKS